MIDFILLYISRPLEIILFTYKDIRVTQLDKGVRENAILGCAEPHRRALSKTKLGRECEQAASDLMDSLGHLATKGRGLCWREAQEKGDGNETPRKVIEKAARSLGMTLTEPHLAEE